MSEETRANYTEHNRRAWNEIASVRSKTFPPASFFAAGGSTLDPRAAAAVRVIYPDLANLRLIHLQCATGEDTLSWSLLGVQADGVDISDNQVKIATTKASEAGLNTRFHASDVYALPGSLPEGWLGEGYDLVFTGGGAIVWLPDLDAWAEVVSALLRNGGRLVLIDEHPLSGCLTISDGQLQVVDDYFRRSSPWQGAGWSHFDGAEWAKENKYEFTWPLGDIVTALAKAGLVIERLDEFPGGPEWRFGSKSDQQQSDIGRLPGQYLLIARKI